MLHDGGKGWHHAKKLIWCGVLEGSLPIVDKLGPRGNIASITQSFHWAMPLGSIFSTQKWEMVIEATMMQARFLTQLGNLAIRFLIRATRSPISIHAQKRWWNKITLSLYMTKLKCASNLPNLRSSTNSQTVLMVSVHYWGRLMSSSELKDGCCCKNSHWSLH